MFAKKIAPVAAYPAMPLFEYETNMVNVGVDLEKLDRFLNAKALQGWRVHTCLRVGSESYVVLLDRMRKSSLPVIPD